MSESKEAMDFLMSAGVPTASFNGPIGTTHRGEILAMEKRQQRDLDTNEPAFWEDGQPKWEIVFTIDTGVIDPSIENDDGVRKLYAKGQMLNAIRSAVKASGYRGDMVGGTLAVKYAADGPQKKRGFNPPKQYRAKFDPPVETDMLGEPEPVAGATFPDRDEPRAVDDDYDDSPF